MLLRSRWTPLIRLESHKPPRCFVLAALLASLLLPGTAVAATITASVAPFTGNPLSVILEMDDAADPGNLVITLSVDGGGNIGDLRGLFLNVADESLLAGLSVSGSAITASEFSANAVINLGGGNNLNGGGTPCPCDIGLGIGSPGIGSDDFQSITFTLSHDTDDLDLSLFIGQTFGVRATSVGDVAGSREASSKLIGVVPEPSTALLLLIGLSGLATVRGSERSERRIR